MSKTDDVVGKPGKLVLLNRTWYLCLLLKHSYCRLIVQICVNTFFTEHLRVTGSNSYLLKNFTLQAISFLINRFCLSCFVFLLLWLFNPCLWLQKQLTTRVLFKLMMQWMLIFAIVIRCYRVRLGVGHFIYFKITPVFF